MSDTHPQPASRADALSLAFLVGLFAAVFGRALTGSNVFFVRDILQMYLPFAAFKASALAAREFPFWNPHLFGGAVFAGDLVAQAFYPPSLLLLLRPLALAFDLFAVLHLLWAAAGTYALCRVRGSGWCGALIAAISFGLGGTMVSAISALHFLCSYAWAPWVLAAATLWSTTGRWRWVGVLGLGIALQLLAGDPQAVVVTGLLVLIITARVRALPGLTAAAGLAVMTTAVVWSSTLEIVGDSDRTAMIDAATAEWWSLHPGRLLELFQPTPFGSFHPDFTFWAVDLINGPFISPYYFSIYGGAAVTALAIIGAPTLERKDRVTLLSALAFVFVLSLGAYGGLQRVFFHVLPGWNLFRYPERTVVFVMLLVAVLAARGVDQLASRPWAPRVAALALVPAAFAAFLGMTGSAAFGEALVSSVAGAGALGAVGVAALFHARRPKLVKLALAGVVALDVGMASSRLVWLAPAADVIEHRPRLLAPPMRGRLFRDGSLDGMVKRDPKSATPFFLQKARFDLATAAPNLGLLHQVDYWLAFSSLRPAAFVRLWADVDHDALYDLFAVTNVIASSREATGSLRPERGYQSVATIGPVTNFENTDALPRAFFVPAAIGCGSRDEVLKQMKSTDLRTTVLLETATGGGEPGPLVAATLGAQSLNTVQWKLEAPAPGWLVTSDSHAPGWSARVDGAEAPVLRGNMLMRAVAVPAGSHTVDFSFRPTWFVPGAIGSLLGLLTSIGLIVLTGGRRPSPPPAREPSATAPAA